MARTRWRVGEAIRFDLSKVRIKIPDHRQGKATAGERLRVTCCRSARLGPILARPSTIGIGPSSATELRARLPVPLKAYGGNCAHHAAQPHRLLRGRLRPHLLCSRRVRFCTQCARNISRAEPLLQHRRRVRRLRARPASGPSLLIVLGPKMSPSSEPRRPRGGDERANASSEERVSRTNVARSLGRLRPPGVAGSSLRSRQRPCPADAMACCSSTLCTRGVGRVCRIVVAAWIERQKHK